MVNLSYDAALLRWSFGRRLSAAPLRGPMEVITSIHR